MGLDWARVNELLLVASAESTPGELMSGSETHIAAFSKFAELEVPADVAAWLRHSKGYILRSGQVLYSLWPQHISASLVHALMYSTACQLMRWLPVASDGCGNQFVVPARGDGAGHFPVWFVDQAGYDHPTYCVASEIGRFLEFLLEGEVSSKPGSKRRWPFDRVLMTHKDPEMLNCRGAPLPWEV